MDLEPDFEKRVLEGSVYVKRKTKNSSYGRFAAKMLLIRISALSMTSGYQG